MAIVSVQLQVVEAGNGQVEAGPEKVVFDVTAAALIGAGQQDVGDRAECEFLSADLAEGQARGDLAIPGTVIARCVPGTVVMDAVDENEQVADAPAAGVLEGHRLLDGRVDLEVLAVEIGQAVVLDRKSTRLNSSHVKISY